MMTRRDLLQCLTAAALTPARSFAGTKRQTNFIIIFTDDQGYGDIGAFGASGFETPHLDRMATEGMKFTSFYSAAPVCTPSRAALLTGCYPARVGLGHRVLFPYSITGLDPDEITIADLLSSRGYATACIGKWHLGHLPKFLPTRQGFQYYYGIPYSNDMGNARYSMINYTSPPLPILRNEELVEVNPPQASLTLRYTDEASSWITKNRDRPFFLYLAHSMPHVPIDASEKFKGRTSHGLYGDVIEELDWSVGEILSTLKRHGIDERTLVVLTSDNGAALWPEGRRSHRSGSNRPLRGSKNTTWEGGMRVPCIMRWPGSVPEGRICGELTTTMDMLPTIARLVGTSLREDRVVDGKDIWPLLSGEPGAKSPHEIFCYYRDDRLEALRSGRWKLHVHKPEWEPIGRQRPALLFDLDEDIGEIRDVARENPEVVKRLLAHADHVRTDLGDAVYRLVGKNVRPVGRIP